MIEREGPTVYLLCDDCSAMTDNAEFDEVIAEARAAGWYLRQARGEWEHYCPDCAASKRGQDDADRKRYSRIAEAATMASPDDFEDIS